MTIKIIVVGRLKEKSYSDRIKKYIKWVSNDIKIDIIYIKDSQSKKIEDQITKLSKINFFNICLSEEGDSLSSEEFSNLLFNNNQDIAFFIGGPNGHTKKSFNESDKILSLSAMTLPHEIATLILIEQLFRALSIKKGTPYHRI